MLGDTDDEILGGLLLECWTLETDEGFVDEIVLGASDGCIDGLVGFLDDIVVGVRVGLIEYGNTEDCMDGVRIGGENGFDEVDCIYGALEDEIVTGVKVSVDGIVGEGFDEGNIL